MKKSLTFPKNTLPSGHLAQFSSKYEKLQTYPETLMLNTIASNHHESLKPGSHRCTYIMNIIPRTFDVRHYRSRVFCGAYLLLLYTCLKSLREDPRLDRIIQGTQTKGAVGDVVPEAEMTPELWLPCDYRQHSHSSINTTGSASIPKHAWFILSPASW